MSDRILHYIGLHYLPAIIKNRNHKNDCYQFVLINHTTIKRSSRLPYHYTGLIIAVIQEDNYGFYKYLDYSNF